MKLNLFWLIVPAVLVSSNSTNAQDPEDLGRVKPKFSITKAVTSLSEELQRALESESVTEDLQQIVVLCAHACEPKTETASRIPDRMRHKDRATAFLSCLGAAACVQVIAREGRCEVGTVKCNTKGCGCKSR